MGMVPVFYPFFLVFIMKVNITAIIFCIITKSLLAQLDTNAPWPMFRQNIRHTGQTNANVLGTQKNPVAKWQCQLGGSSYINFSSPAIGSDGTIYIGSTDNRLYAVTNGEVKWQYLTFGPIYSSPAIGADGTIYIGSDDNKLHAINSDGTPKWDCVTSGDILSSPAVGSDGTVYIGSRDNKLYAITNGEIKWTNKLGGEIYHSSPAIGSDGTVYIGSRDDKLYAITNGEIKWTNKLGGDIYSSPTIGTDNTIYIGCYSDNKLYAITNGKIKWTNKLGGSIYSSPAVGFDGTIYIGCFDSKVYAINADGSLKWTNRLGGVVDSSPAIGSDNTVYIGCRDNKLYALTNGSVKWSYTTGNNIYSSPAIGSDGTIYIGSYDKNLYAIGENHYPELLWSGNAGYINDGVKPNTNIGGTYFRFEVKYKDADNDYPITNQVWIDINDNDIYDDIEKFTMYSNSGSSYSNGIVYTNAKAIYYAGDGVINYMFYFKDKYDYLPLPCAPISNHSFTVTNKGYTSTLGWTGELGFTLDGVNPNTNTGGTNFVFRVSYTNTNNTAPIISQVWIDKDDDGGYDISERFDMKEDNIGDVDYTDGKIYTFTNIVVYNGDGILNYKFYFVDDISYSIGEPAANHIFRIIRVNKYYVKTNGNDLYPGKSIEYAWQTIQKAGSTIIAGDTVYILAGNYNENVVVSNSGTAASNIILTVYTNDVTVNGGSGSYCFYLNGKNYIKMAGLELKNATNGIQLNNSRYNTIISNNIHNNNESGIYLDSSCRYNDINNNIICSNQDWGIYLYGADNNTMKNNIIYQNSDDGIGGYGAGGNTFISNICYRNSLDGIALWWASGLGGCNANTLIGNICYKNASDGIYVDGNNNYISGHIIYSNTESGIYLQGNGTWNVTMVSNLIYGNSGEGIKSLNVSAASTVIRNCTLFKNSYGFRRLNSTGVSIRNCIAVSNVNYGFSDFFSLTYSDAYGNGTGDYNTTPGIGCITNNPYFISTEPGNSNFLHLSGVFPSPCIDTGDPADPVPSNGGFRIDIGRYEYIFTNTLFSVKKVNSVSLAGNSEHPIPGATLKYTISYSNNGDSAGCRLIIYDRIPDRIHTDYITNSHTNSQPNWTAEWSTNKFPDQSWTSGDYTNVHPALQSIKWIRWKKNVAGEIETGFFRYSLIIK